MVTLRWNREQRKNKVIVSKKQTLSAPSPLKTLHIKWPIIITSERKKPIGNCIFSEEGLPHLSRPTSPPSPSSPRKIRRGGVRTPKLLTARRGPHPIRHSSESCTGGKATSNANKVYRRHHVAPSPRHQKSWTNFRSRECKVSA